MNSLSRIFAAVRNERLLRWGGFLLGGLAFIGLAWAMRRSPLPWVDETLIGSSALSIARGGIGIATFGVEPERTLPSTLFYGPAFIELAGFVMRVFGDSMGVYRGVCLFSALGLLMASGALAWTLSRSAAVAAIAVAAVALAPEIGSRATDGRMDCFAVALSLTALCGLTQALNATTSRARFTWAGMAGLAVGLSILATPRLLPFGAALVPAGLVVVWRRPKERSTLLLVAAVAGFAAATTVCAWAFRVGLGPLGWLHVIRQTSHGDAGNSSPLLGGAWNFQGNFQDLLTPLSAVLGALYVAFFARRRLSSAQLFAGATLLVQVVLVLLLISRPFSYVIYWGTPAAIVALGLCFAGGLTEASLRVPLFWIGVIVVSGALRTVKLVDLFISWESRDPAPVARFVREHIPAGSRVLGPMGLFFWAVEESGSRYESAQGWVGLPRTVVDEATLARLALPTPREVQRDFPREFLLWPEDEAFPPTLHCAEQTLVATLVPVQPAALWWNRRIARRPGYPATKLFQVEQCRFLQ
jgi:hypothetical protein